MEDRRRRIRLITRAAVLLLGLAAAAYGAKVSGKLFVPGDPPAMDTPAVPGLVQTGAEEVAHAGHLPSHGSAGIQHASIAPSASNVFHFVRNPVNGLDTVEVVARMPERADDTTGWLYCPANGDFQANCSGVDANGKPFFDPLPH